MQFQSLVRQICGIYLVHVRCYNLEDVRELKLNVFVYR